MEPRNYDEASEQMRHRIWPKGNVWLSILVFILAVAAGAGLGKLLGK